MGKFIPYEKLSKKKQKELSKLRRATWGELNPVTRKPKNPKAYQRQKTRDQRNDFDDVSFVFCGTKSMHEKCLPLHIFP